MTTPDELPDPAPRETALREPAPGEPAPPDPEPSGSVRPQSARPAPVLPEQSREDTDEGWGEYPQSDDRLSRDRPPHWDDF